MQEYANPGADFGARLQEMSQQLRKRATTILILRGILAIALGIFLVAAPALAGASLGTFISVLIAFWLIIEGIGTSTLAWQERKLEGSQWGWPFTGGIVAVLAGISIFIFPLGFAWVSTLFVLWLVVFSEIVRGITFIVNRKNISGGLALGITSVIFGVLLAIVLLANPTSTIVSLVWVMGIFGIVNGIFAIIAGIKVRPKKN